MWNPIMNTKACNVCKGRFSRPCIICGFSKPEKKKVLTKEALLERDARREEIMMYDHYSRNIIKYGNYGTKIVNVDSEIQKHRELANQIYDETQEKSLALVAKKHDLTVNQVKRIAATALMQRNTKTQNQLLPALPEKAKPTEAEIAEIRRERDTRKIKVPTFSKWEEDDNGDE